MARKINSIRISYTARPDATPETETTTLARVYAYVLRRGLETQAEGERGGGPERENIADEEGRAR